MTKSRAFPGVFGWRMVRRRSNIRADDDREMMGEASHAKQRGDQQAPRERIAIG
jgi:hypothetical protein